MNPVSVLVYRSYVKQGISEKIEQDSFIPLQISSQLMSS